MEFDEMSRPQIFAKKIMRPPMQLQATVVRFGCIPRVVYILVCVFVRCEAAMLTIKDDMQQPQQFLQVITVWTTPSDIVTDSDDDGGGGDNNND